MKRAVAALNEAGVPIVVATVSGRVDASGAAALPQIGARIGQPWVRHAIDVLNDAGVAHYLPCVSRAVAECPVCRWKCDPEGEAACDQCGMIFRWAADAPAMSIDELVEQRVRKNGFDVAIPIVVTSLFFWFTVRAISPCASIGLALTLGIASLPIVTWIKKQYFARHYERAMNLEQERSSAEP